MQLIIFAYSEPQICSCVIFEFEYSDFQRIVFSFLIESIQSLEIIIICWIIGFKELKKNKKNDILNRKTE